MAWKKVEKYSLGYDIPNKKFLFDYQLEGSGTVQQIFPSPEEFVGLAEMFRTAGAVNFNTDGNYFATALKKVG